MAFSSKCMTPGTHCTMLLRIPKLNNASQAPKRAPSELRAEPANHGGSPRIYSGEERFSAPIAGSLYLCALALGTSEPHRAVAHSLPITIRSAPTAQAAVAPPNAFGKGGGGVPLPSSAKLKNGGGGVPLPSNPKFGKGGGGVPLPSSAKLGNGGGGVPLPSNPKFGKGGGGVPLPSTAKLGNGGGGVPLPSNDPPSGNTRADTATIC